MRPASLIMLSRHLTKPLGTCPSSMTTARGQLKVVITGEKCTGGQWTQMAVIFHHFHFNFTF